MGTSTQWTNLSIGSYNWILASDNCYYYSKTQPTDEGNYWHYVDGIPTKW